MTLIKFGRDRQAHGLGSEESGPTADMQWLAGYLNTRPGEDPYDYVYLIKPFLEEHDDTFTATEDFTDDYEGAVARLEHYFVEGLKVSQKEHDQRKDNWRSYASQEADPNERPAYEWMERGRIAPPGRWYLVLDPASTPDNHDGLSLEQIAQGATEHLTLSRREIAQNLLGGNGLMDLYLLRAYPVERISDRLFERMTMYSRWTHHQPYGALFRSDYAVDVSLPYDEVPDFMSLVLAGSMQDWVWLYAHDGYITTSPPGGDDIEFSSLSDMVSWWRGFVAARESGGMLRIEE